ncbi:MAG: hypothetical protein KDD21_02020 [Bacteroidetes bacterium]|nr:hypothetical protein [Bacteroidota bacterium]
MFLAMKVLSTIVNSLPCSICQILLFNFNLESMILAMMESLLKSIIERRRTEFEAESSEIFKLVSNCFKELFKLRLISLMPVFLICTLSILPLIKSSSLLVFPSIEMRLKAMSL